MTSLPGSCGYPILGDKSIEFYQDPERFISTKMEENGSKIFQSRLLNQKTVFVCSYEGTRQLLEERWLDFEHGYRDFLYNSFGDNILFENGETASHLKKCMLPAFSNISIHNQAVKETCDNFFASFCTNCGQSVNVYNEFKALMTNLCLELFLGFSSTSETCEIIAKQATLHWHGIISMPVNLKLPFAGETGWRKALDAKEQLLIHIREKMGHENWKMCQKGTSSKSTGENPGSFLQAFMKSPFKNPASEVEQHILLFISALIPKAFSSIITSFVLEMAGRDRQEMRARALTDEEFHSRVLLEVQRLWPPFFGGRRVAKKDTVIGGYKVPRGYAAIYVSYFAQRDESVFADAHKFNPDRWLGNGEHTAANSTFTYGRGVRQCIGHRLIQHILLNVTKSLLDKYEWFVEGAAADKCSNYKMLPVARPSELPSVTFVRK